MPKRIVVLTSFMHGRGGDIISATSFMKSVLSHDTDVEFEWIVKRDLSGFQKDVDALKNTEMGEWQNKVHLTCINSRDYDQVTILGKQVFDIQSHCELTNEELTDRSENNWGNIFVGWNGWTDIHQRLNSPPTSTRLNECDMIVVNANPHRLIQQDYQLLATFNKPIRLIPEYDLEHNGNTTYDNPNVEIVHTGFGGSNAYGSYKGLRGQGVYIDETAVANNGLDNAAVVDATFIHHLTQDNLDAYKQTHTLFYGYFFDIEQHVLSHYIVTTASFITNSIMLAMDSIPDKKNIDIVIPGFRDPLILNMVYQQALDSLPDAYKNKLNRASYDLKQDDLFTQTVVDVNDGQYSVRLINPQRLERKTVQALLNDSEHWVGLTGDASWIEGLMKGKIVCYQVVRWKEYFFRGFLSYLQQKLPHSPLTEFYQAQRDRDSNIMRTLYQTRLPQMQEDAKCFAQFLMQEKNLSRNMIPRMLQDLERARTGTLQQKTSEIPVLVTDEDDPNTAFESTIETNSLETFIDRIREYLDLTIYHTKQTFWSSSPLPAADTLRSSLEKAKNLAQVCAALTQYYQCLSQIPLLAGDRSDRPDKKQFEQFMLRIGVIDSDTESNLLETKLQHLEQRDLDNLMLQPVSRLH